VQSQTKRVAIISFYIPCLVLYVSLNGKPVTLHETNYHYKIYLDKLLNYGSDASGTHLVSSLWNLDSSQELKDNNGYSTRLNYIGNSQIVELYGRLHADLFNSDKTLINGVDMNIKLTRTQEAFYLLATTDDTKVRFKILDATLFITHVFITLLKILDATLFITHVFITLLLAHANVLPITRKAHYPVMHIHIKTFTASSGTQQIPINNAFLGPVPERIPIVLVKMQHLLVLPVQIPFTFTII